MNRASLRPYAGRETIYLVSVDLTAEEANIGNTGLPSLLALTETAQAPQKTQTGDTTKPLATSTRGT